MSHVTKRLTLTIIRSVDLHTSVRKAQDLSCAILLSICGVMAPSDDAALAQTLDDYTAYPPFISDTVTPNVLFVVDLGDQTIEAAYTGANHRYAVSFKAGTATDSQYAANVTFDAAGNPDLVAVDGSGAPILTATTAAPIDAFDPARSYYGFFDPLRCYVTDSNSFNFASAKTAAADACASTAWDGNFLNWLAMRKKDVAYQALVGGTSLPASANVDGTANSLAGERTTGENGTNDTCANNAKSCWRYVKFVPDGLLAGRVPTTLPNPAVSGTNVADGSFANAGRFFGLGEGTLYVNDDSTPDPFDTVNSNQYALEVDLGTEPDVPSGTGSANDHCNVGQPGYAGHLVCYKRARSLGLFQKLQLDNMHVGVMFVNAGSGQAAKVQFEFDDSFNPSSITNIRNAHIQTHSPLAESLYEALCLFRKSQGPCYSNSGSSSTGYDPSTGVQGDPFYFASLNQMIACCKSFVLMISPGVATSDGNAPDLQQPFGDLFAGANNGLVTSGAQGDRLDDVALYGRTNDIRNQAAASPVGLPGTQRVTFYAVNAMGGASGAGLLSSAAKFGAFDDLNSDNLPDATGQSCTYPAGSTLGSGAGVSSPEWDQDQDCIPDTYFEASEGGDLEDKINKAIAAILKDAASGSAASVIASSSTGEGALYQSFFFPSTFEGLNEIAWTGYTQALFLDAFGNLREDSNGDGRLTYEDDLIVQTRFDATANQVVVDQFDDADANGLADSATPVNTIGLRNMAGLWEAGARLAQTAALARNLVTWVDLDNDRVVDGGEQIDFTTANGATLAPYLRPGAAPFSADNIIRFVRGEQIAGLRDRQITVGGTLSVWKLGDPVHAQPVVVSAPAQRYDLVYGDSSYTPFVQQYKNRRHVAYVGANDGMLHAFNAGYFHRGDDPGTAPTEHGWFTRTPTDNSGGPLLGQELFGFIPQELLPHLKWLTDPDYTHVYYVDLTPKVTDARIFTPDADHPNGWGTILLGGFRLGGSCGTCTSATGAPPMTVTADFNYDGDSVDPEDTRTFYSAYFVLDITNPESPGYPKLLWSYSTAELGLTTSVPSMLRVNPSSSSMTDNTDAKWFMLVGSGPTGYDGSAGQAGRLYAIDLATGPGVNNSLVTMFDAETSDAFMGRPVTIDRDFDYRVDVTYMGSAIDDGSPVWRGKLYRLTTHDCVATPCSPNTWGIAPGLGGNRTPTEILDTFPSSGSLKLGPVTSAPAVAIDDGDKLWVFAGTGRHFNGPDRVNADPQYFLGVKDSVLNAGCTESTATNCHQDDLVDVSAAQVCLLGVGDCGSATNQVTGVTGASDFPSLITLVASRDGWFTSLPGTGERVLVRPSVFGGLVLFPTFTPGADACQAMGQSALYALYYLTGSAYSSPVIGTTSAGANKHVNKSIGLGQGLASEVAVHMGVGSKFGQAGAFSQTSLGQVFRLPMTVTGAVTSRRLSWLLLPR